MSSPAVPVSKTFPVWMVVAQALCLAACSHGPRAPLGTDRSVEAGVPVHLGGDNASDGPFLWDTGEGAPAKEAPFLDHAFARPGVYTVRALEKGVEVSRVTLTVQPRPLLRAVPFEAEQGLFFPRMRGNLDAWAAFVEQLVGADNAQRLALQLPLTSLVLANRAAGQQKASWVDFEEGLGSFSLPQLEARVSLVGVVDSAEALRAVVAEAQGLGADVRQGPNGLLLASGPEYPQRAFFVDRGYLYAVTGSDSPAFSTLAQEVHRKVSQAALEGISEHPELKAARSHVSSGQLIFFHTQEKAALWVGFQVQSSQVSLDGFLTMPEGVASPRFEAPAARPLDQAPEGPVVALQCLLPSRMWGELLFGAPGSERRQRAWKELSAEGVQGEELLGSLRGDVSLLAYFDAGAFFANLVRGNGQPEPRGSLMLDVGLLESGPLEKLLAQQLSESGVRVEKEGSSYRGQLWGQPTQVTFAPNRMLLKIGEEIRGRAKVALAQQLRTRFGAEAWAPNHLSLMVDLGRLRSELESPRQIPGVAPDRLTAMQAFAGSVLDQLTPFDSAFVDFSAEKEGARLKGQLFLRQR